MCIRDSFPATRLLVGLARQQRREVHLVRSRGGHLLADDLLDLRLHPQAERQPGEHAGGLPADVPGAHQELVAGDLGVGRVFAQRLKEVVREASQHGFYRSGSVQAEDLSLIHI